MQELCFYGNFRSFILFAVCSSYAFHLCHSSAIVSNFEQCSCMEHSNTIYKYRNKIRMKWNLSEGIIAIMVSVSLRQTKSQIINYTTEFVLPFKTSHSLYIYCVVLLFLNVLWLLSNLRPLHSFILSGIVSSENIKPKYIQLVLRHVVCVLLGIQYSKKMKKEMHFFNSIFSHIVNYYRWGLLLRLLWNAFCEALFLSCKTTTEMKHVCKTQKIIYEIQLWTRKPFEHFRELISSVIWLKSLFILWKFETSETF